MLIRSTWTLTVAEPALLPRAYHLELVKELHRRLDLEVGSEAVPSVSFSGIQGFYQVSKDFQTFTPY